MVANMVADMVADKVVDMVADMEASLLREAHMLHCSTNTTTTTRNRPCCGWCTLLSVFIRTDRKKILSIIS